MNRQPDGRYRPNQPLNIFPENGAKDEPLNVTLYATAFHSRDLKNTKEEAIANRFQRKAQKATQWQIRSADGSYENAVWDMTITPDDTFNTAGKLVLSNKLNEVSLPYDVLKPLSTYFWRVRYQADDDLWSEWSDETRFATMSFVVQPYLQNVTQTSIVVMWEDNVQEGYVQYGPDRTCNKKASGTAQKTEADTFIHKVSLEGLAPQTAYYYRVVSGSYSSPITEFKTAPHRDTPFTFSIWADSQTGPQVFETLLDRMVQSNADFALAVGDMASNGGIYSHVHNYHVGPLSKKFGGKLPWFQTWGSHDGKARIVYDYVSLPDRSGTFSFNYGNSHFTFLSIHNLDAEHVEWLRSDLSSPAAQDADFRFFSSTTRRFVSSGWMAIAGSGKMWCLCWRSTT